MEQPTVTVSSLNHAFGQGTLRKPVLTEINLKIYPGEIIILAGPSGSGKTTLLSLIGGLRSVQAGSLKVLGKELQGIGKHQMTKVRNQIGFIFQHNNLLKCLSAAGNVRMSLKLHPEIPKREYRQRVTAILESVGLGDKIDSYPAFLSGGQQQRVAIARALVAQPKLVLADEPTAALDSKTGRDIVDAIQRLAKETNCSVLLVTHDNRISDIADRIIQIEDGRIK
ncbi:ATP-binding cassette domain-containing protein [Chroococcidiopsis sp. FACHB-1243]|uniref:ATP-binding cassette domain-containing protein n=1 Tax=Chroococcidiopsis sp. [FACHB-1243] TaxID=2692781 RepID=UPI0017846343|nr:ATP-binding cassette domain-containing protein [Chroococcidiopsis sp. [FACHB-1243]]MBD2307516.1 ATP-binding cassette domain-containing protein [Chroococcidiopsis sp. [FACHB-1243]]